MSETNDRRQTVEEIEEDRRITLERRKSTNINKRGYLKRDMSFYILVMKISFLGFLISSTLKFTMLTVTAIVINESLKVFLQLLLIMAHYGCFAFSFLLITALGGYFYKKRLNTLEYKVYFSELQADATENKNQVRSIDNE